MHQIRHACHPWIVKLKLTACIVGILAAVAMAGGELELLVVDRDTGQPVAVRMHLKNQRGRVQRQRRLPFWHDHFAVDGRAVLKLPNGSYTFEIERGPEYKLVTGQFIIRQGAEDNKAVEMQRFVDMKKEGWWSGDLHLQRPLHDIPLLMLAEDLHVAPVVTWHQDGDKWSHKRARAPWLRHFDGDRYYHKLSGKFTSEAAQFLALHGKPAWVAGNPDKSLTPVLRLLDPQRHELAEHFHLVDPAADDMPLLVAHDAVDSIGLAHSRLWRHGVDRGDSRSWARPHEKSRYPGSHGVGLWSTEIYYHLLNCGLRLPPAAGSGSGFVPNPVGYNRVYVHIDGEFTYERWWQSLVAGRVVVTNGPLLRPMVHGRPPGYVFLLADDNQLELEIDLRLSTRDPIEYLEIVQDGRVVHVVRLEEWAAAAGRLPAVRFHRSGWFLVRAVTDSHHTFRFASTGPYYVLQEDTPRISRVSAQFLLDWLEDRAESVQREPAGQQEALAEYYDAARRFWKKLVEQANAD